MEKVKGLRRPFITKLPLIVWLLVVLYGLLKIDVGDTPGRASYGWLFVFLGMPIESILLLIAFILNIVFLIKWWLQKGKTATQRFLLTLFTGSLISAVIIGGSHFSLIIFGTVTFTMVSGQLYVIMIGLMAITGHLLPKAKAYNWFKTTAKADSVALLIIVGLLDGFYGGAKLMVIVQHRNLAGVIERDLRRNQIPGKVKVISQFDESDASQFVDYTVQQGTTKVYAKAGITGKKHLKVDRNSLTSYDDAYQSLMTNVARSKTAKEVTQTFKRSLTKSVKAAGLTQSIQTTIEDAETAYDRPAVYFNYESSKKAAKHLAQMNMHQKKQPQTNFGGYPAIAFKAALAKHILIVNVPADGTLTNKEFNRIVQHFDASKLPDGYYEVDNLDVKRPILVIENHKVIQRLKKLSCRIYENPEDSLGNDDSDDF